MDTLLDTLLEYQNEWMKRERDREEEGIRAERREEKERTERIEERIRAERREKKERTERIERERIREERREEKERTKYFELLENKIMHSVSTMLALMLGKQHYPQCSQQIDEWQQETESYFWQNKMNINQEIDKVESILDSSLEDFNQSLKNNAIPFMYQHDDKDYYDDNPDDGVEVLQKEIRQYEEEDGGNQRPAKQQRTKQQIDNKENDANHYPTTQQAKQIQERDTKSRSYGAKLVQKYWRNRFDELYDVKQRPYRAIQYDNDEDDANNCPTKQQRANEVKRCDKQTRPYGAKTINKQWRKTEQNGDKNLFSDCPTYN